MSDNTTWFWFKAKLFYVYPGSLIVPAGATCLTGAITPHASVLPSAACIRNAVSSSFSFPPPFAPLQGSPGVGATRNFDAGTSSCVNTGLNSWCAAAASRLCLSDCSAAAAAAPRGSVRSHCSVVTLERARRKDAELFDLGGVGEAAFSLRWEPFVALPLALCPRLKVD